MSNIQKLTKIELKEIDLVGTEDNTSVYRYRLDNHQIVVKCFQD